MRRSVAKLLRAPALALALATPALAAGWPAGTELTMLTGDGVRVVGIGVVDANGITLTLAREFRGIAVLMIETPDGQLTAFDCMVADDGTIYLSEAGRVTDLRDRATASGRQVRIGYGEPGQALATMGGDDATEAGTTGGGASTAGAEASERGAVGEVPAAAAAGDLPGNGTATTTGPEGAGPVEAAGDVEAGQPGDQTDPEQGAAEEAGGGPDDEPGRGPGRAVREAGEAVGKALEDLVRRVGGVLGGGAE